MEVFVLHPDANNYANLVFADEDEWELIYRFDGSPLGADWVRIGVELLPHDRGKHLPVGDILSFHAGVPVFTKRSAEILSDFLENSGEVLPLDCGGEEFFLLNVTKIIDALDEPNSDVVYLSSGRILDVRKAIFDTTKLQNADIFKIPQTPLGKVYVSEKFVRVVREKGLTGFLFEPV